MFSQLLALVKADITVIVILIILLIVFSILWGTGTLRRINEAISSMKQGKKKREEEEIHQKEEARKKAIVDEKERQRQQWVKKGYAFHNIDIKKVCKNFINKIGEEKFYCPDLIILQTILITYPPLINLYPSVGLYKYYTDAQIIIQTLKKTIFEKEQLQDNEENLIRCYSTIKKTVLSILAEDVGNEFELTGENSLTEFLSNECIVHDDQTNIFKLSIYENVNNYLDYSLIKTFEIVKKKIEKERQSIQEKNIRNSLFLEDNNENKSKKSISLEDLDFMTGVEFERYLGEEFSKIGYAVNYTKASGDQGIDLILTKNNQKTGVQAKCYSQKVSNSAVQEAVAGKSYYHLDRVIVITNNYFTQGAKELASSNNVILWDRDVLKEKFFNEL